MRPRLAISLALLVLTPLALLVWIGARGAREERALVRRRIRELIEGRLLETALRVEGVLVRREQEIQRSLEPASFEADALRQWVRRLPFASQVFLLGADAKLLFPEPGSPLSESELEFLERAAQVFRDRDRFFRDPEPAPGAPAARERAPAPERRPSSSPQASARPGASGWYSWYWGGDVQLVYWHRLPSGAVLGTELNRARFIADVITALPSEDALPAGLGVDRIRLVDSKGDTLFAWGSHEPGPKDSPAVEIPLKPPLGPWRLQHFPAGSSLEESLARRGTLELYIGLAALGLAVGGLGLYFWKESSRGLREAEQRVSFVNQVSHELKTPLTNIRIYAELLQDQLAEEPEKASAEPGSAGGMARKSREHAEVIALESRRLSRLIGNILTFARRQRDALRLRRGPGNVDETVGAAVERFRPSLAARGVEVRFEAGAAGIVHLDADSLEQILDNLLGNVEKYAPGSGVVDVLTRREGQVTTIVVADRGQGIPERYREEVFKPFRRLSDKLTDGVSGTGLGLTIARDLARLHGGDLRLLSSDRGARFQVTLETPEASAVPDKASP